MSCYCLHKTQYILSLFTKDILFLVIVYIRHIVSCYCLQEIYCILSLFTWDTLYISCPCLRETHCILSLFTWDTLYLVIVHKRHSVFCYCLHETYCIVPLFTLSLSLYFETNYQIIIVTCSKKLSSKSVSFCVNSNCSHNSKLGSWLVDLSCYMHSLSHYCTNNKFKHFLVIMLANGNTKNTCIYLPGHINWPFCKIN